MGSNSGSGNITTGAASATVMASRLGRRVAFSVTNYGSNMVWVNLSDYQVAAAGVGIPLYPGGTIQDSDGGDNYRCYQGTISCINSAAGSSTLAFWERVRE